MPDTAEHQDHPGAEPVRRPAHQRALQSALHPAQHLGEGDGGEADAQFVAEGNDVGGEALIESAVFQGVHAGGDYRYPPAVEHGARQPYLLFDLFFDQRGSCSATRQRSRG